MGAPHCHYPNRGMKLRDARATERVRRQAPLGHMPNPPRGRGTRPSSPLSGSYATGSATRAGSRTVNVEPRPLTLVTVRSPPIIRQNARLIASPSPVPPYLLRVDASA